MHSLKCKFLITIPLLFLFVGGSICFISNKYSLTIQLISLFLFTTIGIVFSFYLYKSVMTPIANLKNRINLISKGDFNSPLRISSNNSEIHELFTCLQQSIDNTKLAIEFTCSKIDTLTNGDWGCISKNDFKGNYNKIGKSLYQLSNTLETCYSELNLDSKKIQNSAKTTLVSAQRLSYNHSVEFDIAKSISVQLSILFNNIKLSNSKISNSELLSKHFQTELISFKKNSDDIESTIEHLKICSNEFNNLVDYSNNLSQNSNDFALISAIKSSEEPPNSSLRSLSNDMHSLAIKNMKLANDTTSLSKDFIKDIDKCYNYFSFINQQTEVLLNKINVIQESMSFFSQNLSNQVESCSKVSRKINQLTKSMSITSKYSDKEIPSKTKNLNSIASQLKSNTFIGKSPSLSTKSNNLLKWIEKKDKYS